MQLATLEANQVRDPDQDGGVAGEVRRREKHASGIREDEVFLLQGIDAEHENVVEALPGHRVDGIRAAPTLEDESLAAAEVRRPSVLADLLHRLGKRQRELVEIGHRRHARSIVGGMKAATVAGLLANEERLRVFAAIALGATTIDEVVDATGLSLEAVQSALPRFVGGGIVRGDAGLTIQLDALQAAARDRPARERGLPGATPEQDRVLRNFAEAGRLKELPARAAQRRVVLEYIASRFDEGAEYTEPEINERLQALHEDYASLRRYLVDERLLERRAGIYRRCVT